MTDKPLDMWKQDGILSNIGRPDWLANEFLQTLMIAFESAGFQIFAVGGCVRDTVLDRPVKDVDLSTDARPSETIKVIESLMFRGKPWKAVPTGIDHGTITAVSPQHAYEITTFRTDVETDGRHATVAFSHNIEDDAKRRDFTINAFYADRVGNVHDVVGGSTDLKAQIVRFIGDPVARIEEDYLRILRFFRFTGSHGKLDDGIDANGLAACAMLAEGLEGISRERIGGEMTRLISAQNSAPIIGAMEQSGVLNRILPGASVLTLARLIDLEESVPTEGRMLPPIDTPTRLASLGSEDIADRLHLSNADAKKVALVREEAGKMTPPHELGYRYGYWDGVHCLILRWASLLLPFDETSLPEIAKGAEASFPVSAADLMPEFSGKALGDTLKKLEAVWIDSKFETTKAELLALR